MDKLIAFHGDPSIKQKYMNRLKVHYMADEIVKGVYWQYGKGCAVGCTIHGDKFEAYEKELGIPSWLARFEETLFEQLPDGEAKEFPLRFLESIPVGADLTSVKPKFFAFLTSENIKLISPLQVDPDLKEKTINSFQPVLRIHEQMVKTGIRPKQAAKWAIEGIDHVVQEFQKTINRKNPSTKISAFRGAIRAAFWSVWPKETEGVAIDVLTNSLGCAMYAHGFSEGINIPKLYSDKLIQFLKESKPKQSECPMCKGSGKIEIVGYGHNQKQVKAHDKLEKT